MNAAKMTTVTMLDPLRVRLLKVAADNDGLWEFAQIVGRKPTGLDAFRALSEPMIELVRSGFLALWVGARDLAPDEAATVLADPAMWVLPWEPEGDWHTRSDAVGVSLTPAGEAALSSVR